MEEGERERKGEEERERERGAWPSVAAAAAATFYARHEKESKINYPNDAAPPTAAR